MLRFGSDNPANCDATDNQVQNIESRTCGKLACPAHAGNLEPYPRQTGKLFSMLLLEPYHSQLSRLPAEGAHIIGQLRNDTIVVYQAFNLAIAAYAVAHQQFGGSNYSFNRMSWIKPGFLWMMYRSGWATKPNQERILAISLPLDCFREIVAMAVPTSFAASGMVNEAAWQQAMTQSPVRIQWDPDHDPYGAKLPRRAIQLGMSGQILRQFATEWVTGIEDITPLVQEQYAVVRARELERLIIPMENVVSI